MLALIARAAAPGDEEDAGPGEAGTLFGAAEVTGVDVLAAIRDEPGNVSVKTIGQGAFKLGAIRAVGLPHDLFADVAPKVLAGWRARVAAEAPSHLRSHPHEVMVTLLAAYLYCRQREITDALADLLIATVHRINARADTKVTSDFVAELKRVSGKENILFKMTEAALQSPGERVEDVIYPAVPGGHEALVALLREYKANGTSYRQHRQRVFKASYTSHYRTGGWRDRVDSGLAEQLEDQRKVNAEQTAVLGLQNRALRESLAERHRAAEQLKRAQASKVRIQTEVGADPRISQAQRAVGTPRPRDRAAGHAALTEAGRIPLGASCAEELTTG